MAGVHRILVRAAGLFSGLQMAGIHSILVRAVGLYNLGLISWPVPLHFRKSSRFIVQPSDSRDLPHALDGRWYLVGLQ
jgi:hypothetical protein